MEGLLSLQRGEDPVWTLCFAWDRLDATELSWGTVANSCCCNCFLLSKIAHDCLAPSVTGALLHAHGHVLADTAGKKKQTVRCIGARARGDHVCEY